MDEWFKGRLKWHRSIMKLSDAEAGRFAKALWTYAATGETSDLSGRESIMLEMCISTLDEDQAHRTNVSAARAAAGAKGGRPKTSKANESKKSNCYPEKANESKKSNCFNKKEDTRNKKEDAADAAYARGGGFISDDDADAINGALNDVFDEAKRAGFPDNQATLDRLNAMCAEYSPEWVTAGIAVCVERGASNPGFLDGVLKKYREQGGVDDTRRTARSTEDDLTPLWG
ncbi:MAG: hypothetical protein IKK34_06950 [Clostridia bacterium]|nr:hypothetical protein [Clostridia bacterium]